MTGKTRKETTQISALKDLQRIPGIGPEMAKDLLKLGIKAVNDLRGKNPEKMYARLCEMEGQHIDRCVLYVFRCAIYFATESRPDKELLKWWNWKD